MAPADAEQIATRSRFALGMAVASLVCIFAFSIPLLTYLVEGLFLAHDVPLSKAAGLGSQGRHSQALEEASRSGAAGRADVRNHDPATDSDALDRRAAV